MEWLKFALRWTIAIVGVTWVVSNLTIRDRVYVLAENAQGEQIVLDAPVAEPVELATGYVVYEDPRTGTSARAPVEQLIHGPDREELTVWIDGQRRTTRLAGMRLREAERERRGTMPAVESLFIYEGEGREVREISLDATGGFDLKVPQPLVRVGLASMVREAQPVLLTLAILVFPITLIATGLRWWRLMHKPVHCLIATSRET